MQHYKLSLKGKIFLIVNEGIALSPYLDSVGVKTLAIGATVSEIPDIADMTWDHQITIQEALDLLDKGLHKYVDAVNSVLDVAIMQHQFDSLVSLCYNIGTGNVRGRVGGVAGSTAIKRINAGEPPASVAQAIMMWNKPPEIIGRRSREAKLFTNGYYGDTKAQLFPVDPLTHKPQYRKSKIIDLAVLLSTEPDKKEISVETKPVVVNTTQESKPRQESIVDILTAWAKEHWLY